MLRVDLSTTPNHRALLVLTGDFTDEYIPCVEHALGAARAKGVPISLNLRNVMLVDRGAMCYLNGLCPSEVTLEECPAYVTRWMEQERGNCG